MDKKKTSEKSVETENDEIVESKTKPAMVTEVVEEVVEDEVVPQESDTIDKKIAEDIPDQDQENTEAPPGADTANDFKNPEGKKQLVEELFSRNSKDDLIEIKLSKSDPSRRLMSWAIIIIVAALVTGIGLILFSSKKPDSSKETAKTAEAIVTVAPTAAPTAPTVNKSDIIIQVLNGGGTPGAASKMKTALTDFGYDVQDVGNTDEYTYETTQIEAKKDTVLEMLKKDLADDYSLGTTAATLADDSKYDAVVIVGKK